MTPEEIYDRYGEKMYHYLALRLGSLEDAEDVLQETFCRLARYSVRWALVRSPRAFVFKILRNEANRFLRRKIGEPRMDILDPDRELETAPVLAGLDNRIAALLSRGIALLPDEQRETVILKVYQGFSFKEIARVCGLSVNTAGSRYRYGIDKLRAFLEGKL
jgi:RNA polymerase sigma-70 factor (ECF subfamily)